MNADKLELEDLILDDSFINYCNQSSPEDVAYWTTFLEKNPSHAALIHRARDIYFQLFTALAANDMEDQLKRLENGIAPAGTAPLIKMQNSPIEAFLPG